MSEYIEREALISEIKTLPEQERIKYMGIYDCIKRQPAAYVAEVRHGKWIYKHRHRGGFEQKIECDEYGNPHTITVDNRYECDDPYCSECGKLGETFLNYCANCGAKLDGGECNG